MLKSKYSLPSEEKKYRKRAKPDMYCANATGNNSYKPKSFPHLHPPTMPEGSVWGSRRQGTPTLYTASIPGKIPGVGCSVEGEGGDK